MQVIDKYKKNIVIDLRRKGFSYSEIRNQIHVPKSTIAFWLRDVPLTDFQRERLEKKRSEVARENANKKVFKNIQLINRLTGESEQQIGALSKRELWLMGIMLFWRQNFMASERKVFSRGVQFISGDPLVIVFFLLWLKEAGRIQSEEITFDLFLKAGEKSSLPKAVRYWSVVTGFAESSFVRVYFQKGKKTDSSKRKLSTRAKAGLIRVRVKSSSILLRQITKWIQGIEKTI